MKTSKVLCALFTTALLGMVGCGGSGGDTDRDDGPANSGSDSYDPELLEEFRGAIPNASELMAISPGLVETQNGTLEQALVGEAALYPQWSWPLVRGVNQAVANMIGLLETVMEHPPTLYNSETQEFWWGPWPNDDAAGYVAVYIKDNGDGADFRYTYALIRGIGRDLANLTPVVWGGANPGPDDSDYGSGITLWDFEANAASLGCKTRRVSTMEQLKAALEGSRLSAVTNVIVVETDGRQRVGGYDSWWDVPVAEISQMESVQRARERYEEALPRERCLHGEVRR